MNGQGEEILEDIPDDWYENVETIGDENGKSISEGVLLLYALVFNNILNILYGCSKPLCPSITATLSAAPEGWMEEACAVECIDYLDVCDTITNDFGETEVNANCISKATCIANCKDKLME